MVLLQFIVSVCSDHFIVDTQMLTFKKLVTVFVLGARSRIKVESVMLGRFPLLQWLILLIWSIGVDSATLNV